MTDKQIEQALTAGKRYINREENPFLQNDVKYIFETYDLADLPIKISF